MRITRPIVLLALVALLAPCAEASRTSVWESNPPAAAVLAKADATSALAALAPAAAPDIETTEGLRFDLGDVVLVEGALEHEYRFGLGPLDLLGPTPLRGPPPSYPETRVRGFELLPPFRVGESPTLSLWSRRACGSISCGLVSDSPEDPWGLVSISPDNPGSWQVSDSGGETPTAALPPDPVENRISRCRDGACYDPIREAVEEGDRVADWFAEREREDRFVWGVGVAIDVMSAGRGRKAPSRVFGRTNKTRERAGLRGGTPPRVPRLVNPRTDASGEYVPRWNRVRTPWQRKAYQRGDIDWELVRPSDIPWLPKGGLTNFEAARLGYAPVRRNPANGAWEDVVLHHVNQDPRGALVEMWRSKHGSVPHNLEDVPWRAERPDWAKAFSAEQKAYWRWTTGAYKPEPTTKLLLPGDPR